VGTARGEVELEGKVLVLKRIAVTYSGLTLDEDQRRTAERVLGFHADACPVDRSLRGAIDITTTLA
jgi:uncharacterized OsmC-like protein